MAQTLLAKKAKNLLIKVEGTLAKGCTSAIVLAIIGSKISNRWRHGLQLNSAVQLSERSA
jgi:homoaconitase/3-isopropylmalate dehydratase large subunit